MHLVIQGQCRQLAQELQAELEADLYRKLLILNVGRRKEVEKDKLLNPVQRYFGKWKKSKNKTRMIRMTKPIPIIPPAIA